MDMIAASVLTTAASSLVSAIVATLVSRAKSGVREMEASSKAQERGIRELLWGELKKLHAEAVERGGLTIEDRRHLENTYAAYHNLGGNGTGTRLYKDAMEMPVID